ncbi:hypothetical protein BBJ28_00016131 [Nothophytophthora sp. Chile5]|nr:hypothetical protein BBJ28_00016131 [Nothophytophthora sp. Chile5]
MCKVLLELQCLKVPTPLLFKVQAAADFNSSRNDAQYCSVQEFSAPDGQVFLPYWLMQSLQVPEGGKVVISSVINIPRGIYCRLQPESSTFLDLAADIGPKARDPAARLRFERLAILELF